MSIRDWGEKIKSRGRELRDRVSGAENATKYYTAGVIILVGLSSFGLGRLSAIDEGREPVVIEQNGVEVQGVVENGAGAGVSQTQTSAVAESISSTGKSIVASRNGTKYYFPWCATNIAEKNKIWFNSEAEARAHGLEPAANCKGLAK